MKVTKIEEQSFDDLDNEEQIAYLKNELFEFATRVVVAVGIAILGIWYASPDQTSLENKDYYNTLAVSDIILFSIFIFACSAYVAYDAYRKREQILDAVRLIQGGDSNE